MNNQTEKYIVVDGIDVNRHVYISFFAPETIKGLSNITNNIDEAFTSSLSGVKKVIEGGETKKEVESVFSNAKEVVNSASDIIDKAADRLITKRNTAPVDLTKAKWEQTIILPIPNELQESLNHDWNEQNGLVASILNNSIGSNTNIGQAINGIAALTGTRNVTTNPDFVQMYSGTKLRGVSFSWTFIPDNKSQAEKIFETIRRFKQFSSGHLTQGGTFITAPYFCKIEFVAENLQEALQFDEMIIKDVNVNYSGAGNMEMFHDGNPKFITLSITFGERRMKTFKDWEKSDSYDETADYWGD